MQQSQVEASIEYINTYVKMSDNPHLNGNNGIKKRSREEAFNGNNNILVPPPPVRFTCTCSNSDL